MSAFCTNACVAQAPPMNSVRVKLSDGSSAVPKTKEGCFSKFISRVYAVLLKANTVFAFEQVMS